ncbi:MULTISPECIES: hypothetical protein [Pseudomonas]|uniref:PRTase-CE domain-containing protein n=1 Tax=Pseudomonas taiwanensis TaxID=470150 RepID=A0A7L9GAR7_9PSED|nr:MULTISPECIES: hypothetical protein [Pseudomonas]QOJ89475.1 hypothetical protein ICN73_16520 [Pseudomonas taiwanensis]WQQ35166.1 hypothetical protein SO572_16165 [Pseudomonas putida]
MAERELIAQLLAVIGDYRKGAIPTFDEVHVQKWINQFDPEVRESILSELIYTFGKTYSSREKVYETFKSLFEIEVLHKGDSAGFWGSVSFLDIQKGGNSQHEFVKLVAGIYNKLTGNSLSINDNNAKAFFYIDDGLFSGGRATQDILAWLENDAPRDSTLYMAIINVYALGQWKLGENIKSALVAKNIKISWVTSVVAEDRKKYMFNSDVLRPTSMPNDLKVLDYVGKMKYAPVLRVAGGNAKNSYFSSESGRNLLEQQFLVKGAHIRTICPNLKIPHRPLGFSSLETLGFGSMNVTYRNCPNNAPLALWAGDPWYPLFPRSTNADAARERALEDILAAL